MIFFDFNDGLYFCFNEILLYIYVNVVKYCISYYFFFLFNCGISYLKKKNGCVGDRFCVRKSFGRL